MDILKNKWVLYGGAAVIGLGAFLYFRNRGSSADDSGTYYPPTVYGYGGAASGYSDGTGAGVANGSSGMSEYDKAALALQEKLANAQIANNSALTQIQQTMVSNNFMLGMEQLANEKFGIQTQKEIAFAANQVSLKGLEVQGQQNLYSYNLGMAQNTTAQTLGLAEIDANKAVAIRGFESNEAIAAMQMVQEIAGTKGGSQVIGKGGQIGISTPYGGFSIGSTGTPKKGALPAYSGSPVGQANSQVMPGQVTNQNVRRTLTGANVLNFGSARAA